jgi:hypothetical protein
MPSYLINELMAECPDIRNYLVDTLLYDKALYEVYDLFGFSNYRFRLTDVANLKKYVYDHYTKEKIVEIIKNGER